MKVTVLVENTTADGLQAEHGLSLFVEAQGTRFLFDMGQTDLFARNADALGIDLNTAAFAVLSHGHYDHGGGIRTFFARNDHARVYMSRHAFEPHYNDSEKYIEAGLKAIKAGKVGAVLLGGKGHSSRLHAAESALCGKNRGYRILRADTS